MAVCVEFYGLARRWAGVPKVRLEFAGCATTLGDVFCHLSEAIEGRGLDVVCNAGRLHPTLSANLDGTRFVSDPATPICDGQCLLILSADAGG
jgi:hypothetical protein